MEAVVPLEGPCAEQGNGQIKTPSLQLMTRLVIPAQADIVVRKRCQKACDGGSASSKPELRTSKLHITTRQQVINRIFSALHR